jgi:aminopeptidase N
MLFMGCRYGEKKLFFMCECTNVRILLISDHIVVPDFAAGAMENWGLITYRMRSLLVNDTTASPADKQWVVIVIAHELAHQVIYLILP